jgi:hypothetical protein
VFLFPMTTSVNGEGFEVAGTITAEDLLPSTPPMPQTTMASLVQAMRTCNACANIHTTIHAGGEIRGQIRTSNGRD